MSVAEILHYTYADYSQWEGDWELIDGIPVAMAPAPIKIHQQLSSELFLELNKGVDDKCLNCEVLYEVDWKINEETVVRPDIVFVCDDEGEAYLTKAPKIVVEIISPATAKKDETIKFDIYESEGVQYYILVYPDDLRAKAYGLKDGRYIKIGDFTHETLEFDAIGCGLSLDFAKVFEKFRNRAKK